jgi:hypothetical protein
LKEDHVVQDKERVAGFYEKGNEIYGSMKSGKYSD